MESLLVPGAGARGGQGGDRVVSTGQGVGGCGRAGQRCGRGWQQGRGTWGDVRRPCHALLCAQLCHTPCPSGSIAAAGGHQPPHPPAVLIQPSSHRASSVATTPRHSISFAATPSRARPASSARSRPAPGGSGGCHGCSLKACSACSDARSWASHGACGSSAARGSRCSSPRYSSTL